MIRWVSLLFLCALFSLTGCSVSYQNETTAAEGTTADLSSDLSVTRQAGILKVGVVPGVPVFYQEEGSKEWTGFGAEMAREYAATLGLRAEFTEIRPQQAASLLEEGEIDCVWGRTVFEESQKERIGCSSDYLKNQLAVIVHFKNKDKDKCKKKDKIGQMREFVVVKGSDGEQKARDLAVNYSTEDDMVHALLRVAAGSASCALVDVFESTGMIGSGTQYENLVYTVTFDLEEYCVGFRKDSDLIAPMNHFLAVSYKEGKTKELAKKYRISRMILPVEEERALSDEKAAAPETGTVMEESTSKKEIVSEKQSQVKKSKKTTEKTR